MDLRDDYASKEDAAWKNFLTAVESVPPNRREDQNVVPGWSVKDLIWHNAAWATFAADHLRALADGTFVDPFEGVEAGHWDEVSQQQIDESRKMTFEQVLSGAEKARESTRETWSSLPEIDDRASEFFAEETFIHYEDHTKEIQQYLDRDPPHPASQLNAATRREL